MKQNVNPAVIIAVAVVLLGGLGFVIFRALTGPTDQAKPMVSKPANPNDPKYKPDPRLGLGGT